MGIMNGGEMCKINIVYLSRRNVSKIYIRRDGCAIEPFDKSSEHSMGFILFIGFITLKLSEKGQSLNSMEIHHCIINLGDGLHGC